MVCLISKQALAKVRCRKPIEKTTDCLNFAQFISHNEKTKNLERVKGVKKDKICETSFINDPLPYSIVNSTIKPFLGFGILLGYWTRSR